MEILPFAEVIKMSKEKLDEAMAPIRANAIKAKADLEKARIDTDILEKTTKVQELFTAKDVSLPAVISLLDEIAILERRNKQYTELLVQLFPESNNNNNS
jgi:hypothetical protein